MTDLTGGVSGVVGGGVSPVGDTTEYPYHVFATANGSAEFGLADDISLKLEGQLWGGVHNQLPDSSAPSQNTILRWYENRYTVFQTRSALSPEGNYFGINELSATLGFKSIGLYLKGAAFSAVEKLAYPYIHNAAGPYPSLQLALFDTSAPADIYGPFIGPLVAVVYQPTFAKGLEFLAQGGTAGIDAFDTSVKYGTLQVKYTSPDFQVADKKSNITGAFYYTAKQPQSPKNEFGETVSATKGFGIALMWQIENTLNLNFGYSNNVTNRHGDGVDIDTRLDGTNISVSVPIADIMWVAAGHSWLGFSEKTHAFVARTENTSEHALDLQLIFPFAGHFSVTTGYRRTFIDKPHNLDPTAGDRQVFSALLSGAY